MPRPRRKRINNLEKEMNEETAQAQPQWCSAEGCPNCRNEKSALTFFSFPKDNDRSRKWVINCNRIELENKSTKSLFSENVLCEEHFEPNCFIGKSKKCKRLKKDAVPTIFNASISNLKPPSRSNVLSFQTKKSKYSRSDKTLSSTPCVSIKQKSSVQPSKTKKMPLIHKRKTEMNKTTRLRKQRNLVNGNHATNDDGNHAMNDDGNHAMNDEDNSEYTSAMTHELTEVIKKLEDRVKYLTDILEKVSRIKIDLLSLCLNVENNPDAQAEFNIFSSLLQSIKFEFVLQTGLNNTTDHFTDENESGVIEFDQNESKQDNQELSLKDKILDRPKKGSNSYVSCQPDISDHETITKKRPLKMKKNLKLPKTKSATIKIEEEDNEKCDPNNKNKSLLENDIKSDSVHGSSICERCGGQFKNQQSLRAHVRHHREKDANVILSCHICGKVFVMKDSLRAHIRIHLAEKKYKCDYCDKSFHKRQYLIFHTRKHSGEKPYVCKTCNKSFGFAGNLKRHEMVHTGEKPWQCRHCGKSFNQSSHLKAHHNSHIEEMKYECSLCNQTFTRSYHLSHHYLEVHDIDDKQNSKFECSDCGKRFRNHQSLKYHMKNHTGERTFTCSVCSRGFIRKFQLTLHMRSHTGDKPYKCEVCYKEFAHLNVCKVHQMTHYDKSFKCTKCDRAFHNPANLKRHMNIHSGVKCHKCEFCDRLFSQKTHLENHLWTHKTEKRFQCEICGRGYNDKRNFDSHLKGHAKSETFLSKSGQRDSITNNETDLTHIVSVIETHIPSQNIYNFNDNISNYVHNTHEKNLAFHEKHVQPNDLLTKVNQSALNIDERNFISNSESQTAFSSHCQDNPNIAVGNNRMSNSQNTFSIDDITDPLSLSDQRNIVPHGQPIVPNIQHQRTNRNLNSHSDTPNNLVMISTNNHSYMQDTDINMLDSHAGNNFIGSSESGHYDLNMTGNQTLSTQYKLQTQHTNNAFEINNHNLSGDIRVPNSFENIQTHITNQAVEDPGEIQKTVLTDIALM